MARRHTLSTSFRSRLMFKSLYKFGTSFASFSTLEHQVDVNPKTFEESLRRDYTTSSSPSSPQVPCVPAPWKKGTADPIAEFQLVSFNMLAPCYKRMRNQVVTNTGGTRRQDVREADMVAVWNQRAKETVEFVEQELLPTASIVALQEFWLNKGYASMFDICFDCHGFEVRTFQRTGDKTDAVALAIRNDVFEIKGESDIHLCSVGDRVALLLWLQHRKSGKNVLVANTHLSFPHNIIDRTNQMRQMRTLIEAIERYAALHNVGPATKIVTGDFNVESDSTICDHLRKSGYYSAFEVCPPMQDDCLSMACQLQQQQQEQQHQQNQVSSAASTSSCNIAGAQVSQDDDAVEIIEKKESGNSNSNHNDTNKNILLQGLELPLSSLGKKFAWFGGANHERKAAKKFVSHRTHRNEELGVDHIFIKPEGVVSSETRARIPNPMGEPSSCQEVVCSPSGEAKCLVSPTAVQSPPLERSMSITGEGTNVKKSACRVNRPPSPSQQPQSSSQSSQSGIGIETERDVNANTNAQEESESDNFSWITPGAPQSPAVIDSFSPSSSTSSSTSVNANANTLLFVADTHVIPSSMPINAWANSFHISDHRPITAHIILANPLSNNNNNNDSSNAISDPSPSQVNDSSNDSRAAASVSFFDKL